jgi:uncharacterized phiE125 gp8 family phage protein
MDIDMSSILLAGPAVEPLTLAEAKMFLRIEHDDDDDVIGALIAAARTHIEQKTRRALIAQSWRLVRDAWPADGRLAVTPVPLQQVAAARVHNEDGSTTAIDPQAFVVDGAAAPAILAFASWSLPAPGRSVAGIEIDIDVGYGAEPADVPEPLRQAVRLLLAHWYENRALVAQRAGGMLPATVAALIAPYRVLSL